MKKETPYNDSSNRSITAASIAIGAVVVEILLLVSLHVISPEFDPSWRVISEYALGDYGWVLSLMFVAGALGNWSLYFAVKSKVKRRSGKIGLWFLIVAGLGSAMASVFAIDHPLHNFAGMIGVFSLPIAAMLISVNLSRNQDWLGARKPLLWTANLTWISLVLFIVSMVILITTYIQAGGDMDVEVAKIQVLPSGVIAFNGWTNRLFVVTGCIWVMTVAWQATLKTNPKTKHLENETEKY